MRMMKWQGNFVTILEFKLAEEPHVLNCCGVVPGEGLCICHCLDCTNKGVCLCKKCECDKE